MIEAERREVMLCLGAQPSQADELLLYNANSFDAAGASGIALPLEDEAFVSVWQEYAAEALERGAAAVLRASCPQLSFPIESGISETPAYAAAVRRGDRSQCVGSGLALENPDQIHLALHPTAAGRIPVIIAEHRADFEALLRAFTARNEPRVVPPAQGASMIVGYNNWERVARYRRTWEREGAIEELGGTVFNSWSGAFRALRARPELYQDRFILLSTGPYSGVTAAELGLSDDAWRRLSLTIRLEHECAHYFTRRVFGAMHNALLDELIADYAGITAAAGRYHATWFLHFMGLERKDAYRTGARLEVYRGNPPLSDGAFSVLQTLVRRAALTVEEVDQDFGAVERNQIHRASMISALARSTIEDLAAKGAATRLSERFS
jgi:hypothetical protein